MMNLWAQIFPGPVKQKPFWKRPRLSETEKNDTEVRFS
jgi:hypothetical protein